MVEANLEKVVEEAVNYFGKIDILINNVGSIGRVDNFESFTRNEWINIFNLNVLCGITLINLLIPYMKQNNHGRVIFISSEKATEPGACIAPYAMTRAAILSVAKSLANEVGKDGITVNCVSPGVIVTPAWDADAKKSKFAKKGLRCSILSKRYI